MPQAPSTRWCPTPEQLMMLEEMYRGGIRTPNASQIQQIATHLSYYGKIENKNVFYWFQNHKARERQKMRKRLSRNQQLLLQQQQQQHQHHLLRFQKGYQQQPTSAAPPPPGHPYHAQVLQMELPHPSQAYANYQQSPPVPQFLPQGQYPEAQTPLMNLVCKAADSSGKEEEVERPPPPPAGSLMGYGSEAWMLMVDVGSPLPACCRPPLKTLDLFPTKSTGDLREECSTSKSSSSSCLN